MFVSHNRSKKDINASVFLAKNTLFLWMSPSLKTSHTLSELLFKGRRVEDQFWFVLPMPVPESPLLVSLISLLPKSQKKESVLEKNVSVNCERKSVPIPSEPLQMYTRRNKMAKNLPQHGQSSTLDKVELNRSESQFDSFINKCDLDVSISFRKGFRSCTQHHIAKFISYHRLNSTFKAFTANLSNMNTLKTIKDALESPKLEETVMGALHKNQT